MTCLLPQIIQFLAFNFKKSLKNLIIKLAFNGLLGVLKPEAQQLLTIHLMHIVLFYFIILSHSP